MVSASEAAVLKVGLGLAHVRDPVPSRGPGRAYDKPAWGRRVDSAGFSVVHGAGSPRTGQALDSSRWGSPSTSGASGEHSGDRCHLGAQCKLCSHCLHRNLNSFGPHNNDILILHVRNCCERPGTGGAETGTPASVSLPVPRPSPLCSRPAPQLLQDTDSPSAMTIATAPT